MGCIAGSKIYWLAKEVLKSGNLLPGCWNKYQREKDKIRKLEWTEWGQLFWSVALCENKQRPRAERQWEQQTGFRESA